MKFTKNEDAVSPVIGVILMVAITVILAAVIAAFVFGMAGNIQKTKVVAATANQQGNTIYVTFNGGQDSADVSSIEAVVDNAATEAIAPTVGSSASFAVSPGAAKNHVVVTATFRDDSKQVILDSYV